ncbi:hypothetical protein HMPREF9374_1078 [Desmospora sp. 8437]|nr:hypothetical protein HMPREF9374_1078 [Desmospora sp. 8437]
MFELPTTRADGSFTDVQHLASATGCPLPSVNKPVPFIEYFF